MFHSSENIWQLAPTKLLFCYQYKQAKLVKPFNFILASKAYVLRTVTEFS